MQGQVVVRTVAFKHQNRRSAACCRFYSMSSTSREHSRSRETASHARDALRNRYKPPRKTRNVPDPAARRWIATRSVTEWDSKSLDNRDFENRNRISISGGPIAALQRVRLNTTIDLLSV